MNLLIHNITIFTNDDQNRVLHDHAVAIRRNRIEETGPERALKNKYLDYKKLDGSGRLLMPGLINAHNHFYGTFARGLALAGTPQNFHDILSML